MRVTKLWPLPGSQVRMVLSQLLVASDLPSGDQERSQRASAWPVSWWTLSPLLASQILAVPSALAVAS